MVDDKNEPMLSESIPNKFSNEESNCIIDQMIDKNGKVWFEENLITTRKSHSLKAEISEDFNTRNDSAVHIFSKLGVRNEIKVEEVTNDSQLKDKNHHMQSENTECTVTKIEDVMCSSMQLELTQEKCDLTSIDSIHSVKTETSDNFIPNAESKYVINQVIDENGKVWNKEDFLTSWNFHSVKMEKSEHINSKTECTKRKDASDMVSSIEMELSPLNCDLPTYLDSIHSKLGNHKCHLCDYSSSWREALRIHIKSAHPKQKTHKCHLCDYSSSWREALRTHIRSIHMKLRNHKCHLCDYRASLKRDLQNHLKSVHLKVASAKCHLSSNSLSQKGHIQQYIISVHSKRKTYKCHLCDYCSSRKGDLQRHIKSVHLKLKHHKCNLCDYCSSRQADLQRHKKSIHLKLKNHKCNLCDYCSSHKGTLEQHMKSVHLKLKNHKCNICDYSTSFKSALQRHVKSVHLKPKKRKCH